VGKGDGARINGRGKREGEGDTHDAELDPAELVALTVVEGQCVNELLFATMLSLVIVSRVKMLWRRA
jgi:hypothetical protein